VVVRSRPQARRDAQGGHTAAHVAVRELREGEGVTGPGTRWRLPGGHEALEVPGSTRTTLRVCVIAPNWPFPKPPQDVARALCERMPSRYLQGKDVVGEALL
jgi:hypothetical protein